MVQEKRSKPRFEAQLGTIRVDRVDYPLENWSDGGFSLGSYSGERKPGDEVEIVYSLHLGGTTLELRGRAMVVWTDPALGRIGGIVTEIDEESRKWLKASLVEPEA